MRLWVVDGAPLVIGESRRRVVKDRWGAEKAAT
jgi:hypothetical protein